MSKIQHAQDQRQRLHVAPQPLNIDCGDTPELVAEGVFDAWGCRAYTARQFQTLKLVVPFRVRVPDDANPSGHRFVTLSRYYNTSEMKGGRPKVGWSSDFAREFALVAGRPLRRRDRLHASIFEHIAVRVQVVTVTTGWDAARERHRPLPVEAQYSKVAAIVASIAGNPRP